MKKRTLFSFALTLGMILVSSSLGFGNPIDSLSLNKEAEMVEASFEIQNFFQAHCEFEDFWKVKTGNGYVPNLYPQVVNRIGETGPVLAFMGDSPFGRRFQVAEPDTPTIMLYSGGTDSIPLLNMDTVRFRAFRYSATPTVTIDTILMDSVTGYVSAKRYHFGLNGPTVGTLLGSMIGLGTIALPASLEASATISTIELVQMGKGAVMFIKGTSVAGAPVAAVVAITGAFGYSFYRTFDQILSHYRISETARRVVKSQIEAAKVLNEAIREYASYYIKVAGTYLLAEQQVPQSLKDKLGDILGKQLAPVILKELATWLNEWAEYFEQGGKRPKLPKGWKPNMLKKLLVGFGLVEVGDVADGDVEGPIDTIIEGFNLGKEGVENLVNFLKGRIPQEDPIDDAEWIDVSEADSAAPRALGGAMWHSMYPAVIKDKASAGNTPYLPSEKAELKEMRDSVKSLNMLYAFAEEFFVNILNVSTKIYGGDHYGQYVQIKDRLEERLIADSSRYEDYLNKYGPTYTVESAKSAKKPYRQSLRSAMISWQAMRESLHAMKSTIDSIENLEFGPRAVVIANLGLKVGNISKRVWNLELSALKRDVSYRKQRLERSSNQIHFRANPNGELNRTYYNRSFLFDIAEIEIARKQHDEFKARWTALGKAALEGDLFPQSEVRAKMTDLTTALIGEGDGGSSEGLHESEFDYMYKRGKSAEEKLKAEAKKLGWPADHPNLAYVSVYGNQHIASISYDIQKNVRNSETNTYDFGLRMSMFSLWTKQALKVKELQDRLGTVREVFADDQENETYSDPRGYQYTEKVITDTQGLIDSLAEEVSNVPILSVSEDAELQVFLDSMGIDRNTFALAWKKVFSRTMDGTYTVSKKDRWNYRSILEKYSKETFKRVKIAWWQRYTGDFNQALRDQIGKPEAWDYLYAGMQSVKVILAENSLTQQEKTFYIQEWMKKMNE